MKIRCTILDCKQSNKFLFMKVKFTKSSFFGLWNCSNVEWIYVQISHNSVVGYLHTKDTNEYVFVKYGSKVESYLSKEAKRLTKEHQEFKSQLNWHFQTAE